MLGLLKKNGILFFEHPLADSMVFQLFREKSVDMDIPRHITLPTRAGIVMLAQELQLELLTPGFVGLSFAAHIPMSEQLKLGKNWAHAEEYASKLSQDKKEKYAIVTDWLTEEGLYDTVYYALSRK